MRLGPLRCLALISLVANLANGSTRPHYGGTLHARMRATLLSLDGTPWPTDPNESAAREKLLGLIGDQLVKIDLRGNIQPSLATSWQHDAERRVWQFHLRPNVQFHDGSALLGSDAAAVLKPFCDSMVSGLVLSCKSPTPRPDLLAYLASPRASLLRNSTAGVIGTGPFRLTQWAPGKRAVLTANDAYWGGRPFVDSVEIEFGRPLREQFIEFELGRADVIEIAPGDVRRASQRGRRVWSSAPSELLVLRFTNVEDGRLREAAALAIDRQAILNVLLQRQGEASGGLLPQWVSGYAFLFSAPPDVVRARQLANEIPAANRTLAIGFDASDSTLRAIADRIGVNVRDAGLRIQTSPPNATLARIHIPEGGANHALNVIAETLGVFDVLNGSSYAIERGLLDDFRVIPIAQIPEIFGLSSRLHNWNRVWALESVWLETPGQ